MSTVKPYLGMQMGTRVLGVGLDSRSCWTRNRVNTSGLDSRLADSDFGTRTGLSKLAAELKIRFISLLNQQR